VSTNQKQRGQTKQAQPRQHTPSDRGRQALLEGVDLEVLQRAVADPDTATPADVLALQRRYGNPAVLSLVAQRQAREEEEETALQAQPSIQRQEEEEEETALQAQPSIQRQEEEEEETPLQPKPSIQRQGSAKGFAPDGVVQRHVAPAEQDRLKFDPGPQFLTVSGGKVGSIYRPASHGRVRLQHDAGPEIEAGGVKYRVSFPEKLGDWADNYEADHTEDYSNKKARSTLNLHIFEEGHVPPVDGEYLAEVLTSENVHWPFKGHDQPIHESRGTVDTNVELDQDQLDIIYDTVYHHQGPGGNADYADHIRDAGLPARYIK